MVRAASVDRNGMKRGAWSEEEDEKLRACINRFGHPNWRLLPFVAGLKRCGKSCRLRWVNYLKPGVKRGNFTKDEENLIIQLHKNLPNKWAAIAAKFPGRTDNDIKNYWHAHIQKKLRNRNRNKAAINNKIQNDDDDDDQSFDDSRTSSCITTDAPNSSSEVEVEVVFHQAEENMGDAAAAAVSESNADSDYNAANLEEEFHGIMEMDDIMSLLFEQPSSNCNFSDFLAEPAVGDEDFFNF